MARIKHYNVKTSKRFNIETGKHEPFAELTASGQHSVTHEGETFEADHDGWIEVSDEAAAHFLQFPGWMPDLGEEYETTDEPDHVATLTEENERLRKELAAAKKKAAAKESA